MHLAVEKRENDEAIPAPSYDVVVMGAGPYGLSAAAHLRAQGLNVAVFGKPLHYWSAYMPEGMLLRSYWWASNLSDPEGKYRMTDYFKYKGIAQAPKLLPIEQFIDYGLWFQQQLVPHVDETLITMIQRRKGLYVVTLEDGRVVSSKTIVMAPGLQYYTYIPEEYAHLPASLVSHSSDHSKPAALAGKQIAIVGKGQGAMELAALAQEGGATVHVITRGPLRWVPVSDPTIPAWIRQMRAPRAGMGEGWLNLLLEKYPYALQHLTREVVDHVMDTKHGPAVSPWLRSRLLGKVTIHEGKQVESVEEAHGRVKVSFADGGALEADQIILGTGYRANINRLPMLDKYLLEEIYSYRGSPVLDNWFETNVPGLYFLGYTSARSFGPLYRFVLGTDAAARRVTSAIVERLNGHAPHKPLIPLTRISRG
jgi:FAD-dependent urate hydroxylase